jgi:uncharacterized hydrophobic protein (TIGR00271 family)
VQRVRVVTVTALPGGLDPMTIAEGPEPQLADARLSLGAAALDDLFPEGDAFRASLVTYTVLLTLASLVATFGLFQDSVASIIGAMVIAPLGGAILAVAGALVTGRFRWQWLTLLQVGLSAVGVVAIGFGISLLMPDLLALTPSLEARTEPTLLDLGVALAAGAAGAFVAARRTGSDALPGVAIAVSLVPPLATVGICLELGRLDDAAGALLLFTTNLAAIVVVASIVFIMTGARPPDTGTAERRRLRSGLVVAVVALVVIALPLAWRSIQNMYATVTALDGAPIVEAWVADQDLAVSGYEIDGVRIELVVAGPQAPVGVSDLAGDLATTLGHDVELTVVYVPRFQVQASASG